MDAKDLKTESVVGARNDGSNKYSQSSTIACDGNKPYQEVGSNSLGKVDIQTSRPCAVIGPDRVVAPSSADLYPKKPPDQWLHSEQSYRRPPDYPLKMSEYQSPTRNISPRQTFQENMQRIMVPPSYNSMKLSGDSDNNIVIPKNKLNIVTDPKYCDVPYNISPLTVDQKSYKNIDISVSIGNSNVNQSAPYMWPANSVQQSRPYGAPEFYQYAEYSGCGSVRTLPPGRPQRLLPEDPAPSYPERYFTDGNVRFKPYPTLKDGYPQQRYECMNNYSNSYHPPPYPPPRYDLQKPVAPHMYSYPQVPVKYIDNRMAEPAIDGFQPRPNPPPSYSVAFHNQFIHPAYGPVPANCLQNKIFPYPPDLAVKQNHISKLAYENNKVYSDFDNVRNKPYVMPEHYYGNDMARVHSAKGQVMLSKHPAPNTPMPGHPYYRNPQFRNYEHIPGQVKNPDYSLNMANPVMRFAPHFSPNTSSLSPSESTNIHGSLQDENTYLVQKPVMSIRNSDMRRINTDMYGRYDYKYGPGLFRNSATHADTKQSSSKDKKNIDVRQFLQQWNDDDENHETNSSKQENKPSPTDQSQSTQNITNQEQLYVLGLVNVPSEELSKYEHIQKISKLPDNIKGYNSLELLNQFEEAIETSNLNNNISSGKIRDVPGSFKQLPVQRATIPPLPRPVSPLDVEAKISQSVIHKEVGCNFEIKPCSPKMLNVEVAAPVQTVLDERVIEKLTNPLSVKSPKPKVTKDMVGFSIAKAEDNQSLLGTNIQNPSCKLNNNQFNSDDCLPSSKGNYSINDLEGNSGVCLASLPRLDNEIEFNFPEVNQQFIDANKTDTVITATTLIDSKSNIDYQQRPETDSQLKDVNLPNHMTALVDSASYPKLSKYRKVKKIENEPQTEIAFSVQPIRTDSVIIKNETAKELNLNLSSEKSLESTTTSKYTETKLLQNSPAVTKNDREEEEKENIIDSFFENHQNSDDIVIDFSVNKTAYSFSDPNYKSTELKSTSNNQEFDSDIKDSVSSQQRIKVSDHKSIDIFIPDIDNDNTSLKLTNSIEQNTVTSMTPHDDNNLTNLINDEKRAKVSCPLKFDKHTEEKHTDLPANKNIIDREKSDSQSMNLEFPKNEIFSEEFMINTKSSNDIHREDIIVSNTMNCVNLKSQSNDSLGECVCLDKDEKNKCFDENMKIETSLNDVSNTDCKTDQPNNNSWCTTLDNSLDSSSTLSSYKKEDNLQVAETDEISTISLESRDCETETDINASIKVCDVPLNNIDTEDLINNNKFHENIQNPAEISNIDKMEYNVSVSINDEDRTSKDDIVIQLNESDRGLVQLKDAQELDTDHSQRNINFSDLQNTEIKQGIVEDYSSMNQISQEVILIDKSNHSTSESYIEPRHVEYIKKLNTDSNFVCKMFLNEVPKNNPTKIYDFQTSLHKITEHDSNHLHVDSNQENTNVDIDFTYGANMLSPITIDCNESEQYHIVKSTNKPFYIKQFSPWMQKLLLNHEGKIFPNSLNTFISNEVNDSQRTTNTSVIFSENFVVKENSITVEEVRPVTFYVPTLKEIAERVLRSQDESNKSENAVVTFTSVDLPQNVSPHSKPILDEKSGKKYSFKTTNSLKRSLSDSALNIFNDQSGTVCCSDHIWPKRRKAIVRDNVQTNLITENYCRLLQNQRRNSISTIFSEDVSFCILIDDNCIIAEECIDSERNYMEEEEFKNKNIFNSENLQIAEPQFVPDSENKSNEDPWIEDVACMETVVSDDVDENEDSIENDRAYDNIEVPSPTHSISEYDSGPVEILDNKCYTNNLATEVKNIHEDSIDTIAENYLINNPAIHEQDSCTDVDRQSLENILTGIDSNKSPNYEFDVTNSNKTILKEISRTSPIDKLFSEISKSNNKSFDKSSEILHDKFKLDCLQKTQYDIIHSCESSIDNVFSYQDREDIKRYSSSPEVSSTTSEEKCSSILLKITNYKGSIISELGNSNDTRRISCKYTENNEYNKSNDKSPATNRPLITKAAQKYIPPLCESIPNLKVKLPLPPHSLLKFKELKKTKEYPKIESKLNQRNSIESSLPKKIKPKFEDVLKSLDEIQIKMHKEKNKKIKKYIPKVVIKKNENGSHYTSSQNNDTADPDLTGRKWQPWVFIERNMFVDKMASRNKTKAIFSHRKNEFILKDSFRRYKSVSSAKFVITQPKVDDLSKGQLKYTIKLKHSY